MVDHMCLLQLRGAADLDTWLPDKSGSAWLIGSSGGAVQGLGKMQELWAGSVVKDSQKAWLWNTVECRPVPPHPFSD